MNVHNYKKKLIGLGGRGVTKVFSCICPSRVLVSLFNTYLLVFSLDLAIKQIEEEKVDNKNSQFEYY